MAQRYPNTRSRTKDYESETEDDYESVPEDSELEDEEVTVLHTNGPKSQSLAETVIRMQAAQTKRIAQMQEEQIRRDQEYQTQMKLMMETLTNFHTDTARPGHGNPAGTKVKKIDYPVLGPVQETNTADFRTWKEGYEGYANLMKLKDECDLLGRRTMLRNALDVSWQKLWSTGILGIGPQDDTGRIMERLYDYVRAQRNPLLDRRDFFERNQRPGENIDHYYADLQVLYDSCDFDMFGCPDCGKACTTTGGQTLRDERIRDRMIFGLLNQASQQKVLEEPFDQLTLERTHKIIQAVESARCTSGDLRNGHLEVNKLEAMKGQKFKKTKKSTYKSFRSEPREAEQCGKCGNKHVIGNCPAAITKCFKCDQLGHWEKHCPDVKLHQKELRTLEVRQLGADGLRPKEIFDETNFVHKAPPIKCMWTQIGNGNVELPWLLDTGAEVNAIGMEHLKQFGKVPILKVHVRLLAAGRGQINLAGKVKVQIGYNQQVLRTEAYIVPSLKRPLLSLDSVKRLQLLPKTWPDIELDVAAISLGKSDNKVHMDLPMQIEDEQVRSQLFYEFKEIFPEDDTIEPLMPMKGPPMDIKLKPNAVPFKRFKANTIPFNWQDKIKRQLDTMEKKDVIETVPMGEVGEWVSSLVPVPKQDGSGEPRITIDLAPLNKYVIRQGYPTKTPAEEVAQIPAGMVWFTTLDSRHGYWQVVLRKGCRHLTTFITPWGHYRFKRNAMGLASAGDEHNMRGDMAIQGIPNVKKIVEDILIYDKDYDTHLKRVKLVLQRCREHGITLHRKKAHFAQKKVQWCGYTLCEQGYTVNERLVEALMSFPVPTSRTDVRSFNGLVQQFEALSPNLAEMMAPIRALLSSKASFLWTEVQQEAFEAVIKELSSPRILALYRPDARLRLETDAAQKTGFGYALWQEEPNDIWKLLRCGSRRVSPAESRYSVTESELAAVVYAVKKLKLYLSGKEVQLIVDHKPLISILNKKVLDEIESPRILKLKEKLSPFMLTAQWRQGVSHTVADVFSRYPVSSPSQDDLDRGMDVEDYAKEFTIQNVEGIDPMLEAVKLQTEEDQRLRKLKKVILEGFLSKNLLDPELHEYWGIRNDLCVVDGLILYGKRIIIPGSMRAKVLKELHRAHQGRDKVLQRARSCVFWPGICNDVTNLIRTCKECETHKASQRREPLMQDVRPDRPGEAIAADLFSYAGMDYLVITDKFSGWVDCYDLKKGNSSFTVKASLVRWFTCMGVPNRLTTDNGPQFKGEDFAQFCKDWGIHHDPSSPYHHIANGYAESAVNVMKGIIKKTCPGHSTQCAEFWSALLEYRNTPRSDGLSPAERLFGRAMRTKLPSHPQVFKPILHKQIREADKKAAMLRAKAKRLYDKGARTLKELQVGDVVRVQHHQTKRWDLIGEVVRTKPRGRSYLIKSETGRLYWRNRRYLRIYVDAEGDNATDTGSGTEPQELRRSTRIRKPPDYYKPT